MTTIRLHSFEGENDGSVSCDFRGPNYIGAAQGDHHQTIKELDVDDSDPLVAETLTLGPGVNALLSKLGSPIAGVASAVLGEKVGLRVGVWDKVPPTTVPAPGAATK